MSPESYGWQPFDPDDDPLPPSLADDGRDGGEVVVLAGAGNGLELNTWAREAATALTRRWSSDTERLFLMDLDLEEPGLHQILGLENGEGATDVFLFGSSLQRIARSVDGESFYFASAGTATADPESVLQNERWDRLIQGFRDAGARLVLYLPLAVPGSSVVLERADRIVVLGPGKGDDERLSDIGAAGTVFLCPPGAEEPSPADVEADAALTPDDEVEKTVDLARDEEVVDIADLAPDEEVVDIASLSPDEEDDEEVGERPSAPRDSVPVGGARMDEGRDEPIVDIDELAPDEPAIDEAVSTPSPAAEVVDIADLAPDADEPEPLPGEPELSPEPQMPAEAEASAESEPPSEAEPPSEPGDEHDVSVSGSALADVGGGSLDPLGEEPGDPVEEEASGQTAEEPQDPAPEFHGEAEPDGRMIEPEPEEEEDEAEDLTPEEADAGADADEFADFDLGSLDAPAEAADEELEDQREGLGADFGAFPEDFDEEAPEEESTEEEGALGVGDFDGEFEEAPEEEPAEEEALGFGDFDGELEEETPAEEPAEEDEGAPDFGDFDGEVEEDTDAVGADEGDGGMDLEPSFAEQSGGPAEPEDTGTEDFGNDLVTGPDFGGGAPEEEPEWETEDTSVGEEPAEEPRAPTAGVAADDEGATGSGREPREAEEAGEGREQEGKKPARPGRDRSSGRPVRLALLLFLVMAAAAAGHWFGIVRVPGMDRALASFLGPAATGPAPVVDTMDPSPTNPILGYSLALDSYRNAQSAGEVGSALRERLPDRLFVVAPIQANGEVMHRLLAGPARNAEEAGALREALAAVLTRENPDDWVVRSTPLAFVVEETPSLETARSRASTLLEQGVSVYVLEVTYPGDEVRYRVYAGAYETPEEARAMQGILGQAGVSDVRFTERRGRLPE